MANGLSAPETLEDLLLLLMELGGNNPENVLAQNFLGTIAEDAFRGMVPGDDLAGEIFGDNGVIR